MPADATAGETADAAAHAFDPAVKLTRMANQIATFFAHQGGEDAEAREQAVAAVADHLVKFWDPRMRRQIRAHLAAGGAGLDPLARDAVARLAD